MDETITTPPQLSSCVALGGAISTNINHRIFLEQLTESERYYVDTNTLIPDSIKKESTANKESILQIPPLKKQLIKGKGEGFTETDKDTLTHIWPRLYALFPANKDDGLVFLFRLSEADKSTKNSLRKAKNDSIYFQK